MPTPSLPDSLATAALVFGCMTFEDTLNAIYVLGLGKGKTWTSGWADGWEDVFQFVGIGYGGAVLKGSGFSVASALVVLAILLGSQAGAQVGDRVEEALGGSKTR